MEAALDLSYSFDLTEMTGFIEVLEIRAQLQKELLGKTVTHRKSILHIKRCKRKITRFSFRLNQYFPQVQRATNPVLTLPTFATLG